MEKEQTQQQIRHIAFNDTLTSLPNRISLNVALADVLAQASHGGEGGILFSIDLDDFKTVNDTFGHSAGDKVIIAAGKTLQEFFTENASVFRVSSDEFIVILRGNSDKYAAANIAERLLGKLCQEYDIENEQQIQLSASMGLVLYPQQGDKLEDILKKADAAMYAAKTAGRNCWRFFTPELLQKTAEDTMMINRLHRALISNELFLQYQPQMTVDGSRLIGLEALLRWDSPDYGLVSPGRFIPLAERSWLIVDIGKWVLQRVCSFARVLSDMGKADIRIAVNISPRQIKDDNFVEYVRKTIKAAEISPQQIEIEVTESVLMENLADNVPKLKGLQNDGMSLALDDFGTGFSSLTYLRTLPVNCLKIDKSFIDKIAFDNMQMRVVASIVELGHTLGMEIVAEGVETQEQLEKLRGCSCDYIQGYIFSKPIDEKEAVKFCLR
ncbi:putative bifunctional diguanylate cyclase/phosphodiesterase [Pectinatus sottacetonis]|uniref:putative bifunctional diguanylate cyclase/phosphodiesterase n=1 Tax=Pectinatus sottacetonis TaxID=1002795 RepID=UPI0018C76AF0|nr:bifunctional diguanylate cyclase/phosphodiesterase [Pectinatus sottacetonis]